MTKLYGDNATLVNASTGYPTVSNANIGKGINRDHYNGDAAQNDTISLGSYPSDCLINPGSTIWFDDMGTSITMDVGDSVHTNTLVAAQDVATAAGSCSLLKSVDIALYAKPLWKMLGYATDPGGHLELLATLAGGNPAAGDISWDITYRPGT